MIIHVHSDGSEGRQYEIGDRVTVIRTVYGGWFDFGPTHAEICTVRGMDSGPWRIAYLHIHYSDDWGLALCAPWQVNPHAETLASAKRIEVSP